MKNKVFLSDVVKRVKNKVDRNTTGLIYYIGGEHFDNGEIVISKKGIIKESTIGPAFRMSFEPGHVLLMSRNPHLRKAGVVDFNGICSDVSYVCETKDETKLRQKFLPFIFQSEIFWEFAEANKKGSTNFFLNWSDFERFKFSLPSIEDQDKLIELLWAGNNTKEAYKKLLYLTDELVKSKFIEMFGDPVANPLGWQLKPFLESGNCKNGINFSADETGVELQYLGVGDFKDLSKIDDVNKLGKVSLNKMPSTEYILQDGDIVFVRSNGNKALVGRCLAVYPKGVPTTYSGFCIRYRKTNEKLTIPYLLQVLKTDSIRKNMAGRGANIQNLNQQILGELIIPIPPIELQNQFADFVKQVDKLKFELQDTINNLEKTIKTLMTKNFV